ncbi:MAG: hypothetical protein KBG02_04885 [Haliscomenobacter sp.]|jgi:hypothetical protein|nr:hypothetical protein [Haliscomenobacter sp.]MBK8655837.1 hypothetical protein [Haliscomenobacter sp.]MBP9076173.1 hypothetical protein [Haliscomenobacter sp.]MBP9873519.1 hypothetical protein [Haliscomenobacter sp.]MBV6427573.1 hypothetical protein [Haliscomenobacter sp.]
MDFRYITLWVFVLLLLGIGLIILYPTPGMLAFGTIVLPFLLVFQVWAILRSGDKGREENGKWYENS